VLNAPAIRFKRKGARHPNSEADILSRRSRGGSQYFDNELVSENIRRTSRLEDGDKFVFEVNINDLELKEQVGRRLSAPAET